MSLNEPASLVARIDAAATASLADYQVTRQLAMTDSERTGELGQLAWAFDYTAALDRTAVGSHFTPMVEGDGWSYPPHLSEISDDVKALWLAAADTAEAPLAVARLNDLCWEAAYGPDRPSRARRAADAYLEQAAAFDVYGQDDDHRATAAMSRLGALTRALRLAAQLDDPERLSSASSAAIDAIRQSLEHSSRELGVVLGLIEVLIETRQRSEDIAPLLEEAKARYADDLFAVSHVTEIKLRLAPTDEARRHLQRELVSTAVEQANQHQGLVRLHHLERAIQLARDFGLSDLIRTATALLQASDPADLELKKQQISADIPAEAVEGYLAQFTDTANWTDALDLLLHTPPSGRTDENREMEKQLAATAPLARLFPRTLIGGDGLPRFTSATDEERAEAWLVHDEMVRAQFNAALLNEALNRIWTKWGPLTEDDLAQFLGEHDHVTPATARALARSLLRFFTGDFEGAAYCLTPRIETLVRALVLMVPLPVYRTQRTNTPGQYPGLGSLIPQLQAEGLDESWARFLHGFLANPMGVNYRNELSHGFIDIPPAQSVALLVVAALFLARGVRLIPRSAPAQPRDPQE